MVLGASQAPEEGRLVLLEERLVLQEERLGLQEGTLALKELEMESVLEEW